MTVVAPDIHHQLAGLSAGNIEVLEEAVGLQELNRAGTGLDARTFALVKLAALVALDAPPASYARQIATAIESGVTAEDCLGVLKAIAPQVGGPRVIAAAPEILVAMGLSADGERSGVATSAQARPAESDVRPAVGRS
ncbi:MAG TPA: carboxymuconolactone decarboxylase family protein [Solirubrobacteraceae bacterium]|jgi:alkylhydroperoxidase/carboxymuconolactone decarboxylase family protein YurZ